MKTYHESQSTLMKGREKSQDIPGTHILSSKDDRTTETDEAAIAAEPIQGCSTRPTGMNTPTTQQRS